MIPDAAPARPSPLARWRRPAWIVLVNLALTGALLELAVALLLWFPVRVPVVQRVAREFYLNIDRDIVQLNEASARYDPELFYTLRPGRFVFAQREFRHEFRVNSLGVRDDEASLDAPDVVVLGDSFAMGWGVAQDDTFAQIIERETGRRVLNAAVSSYGTVREMMILDRVDTRRLKYLILQYTENDYGENLAFFREGNHHVSRDGARWRWSVARVQAKRRYFPGKYAYEAVTRAFRALFPRPRRAHAEPPGEDVTSLFLNALEHAGHQDLSGVRLIVFEINGDNVRATHLVESLRERLPRGHDPEWVRRMTLVDVYPLLDTRRDFWILDEHPNAHAHRVIADALMAAMRAPPPLR